MIYNVHRFQTPADSGVDAVARAEATTALGLAKAVEEAAKRIIVTSAIDIIDGREAIIPLAPLAIRIDAVELVQTGSATVEVALFVQNAAGGEELALHDASGPITLMLTPTARVVVKPVSNHHLGAANDGTDAMRRLVVRMTKASGSGVLNVSVEGERTAYVPPAVTWIESYDFENQQVPSAPWSAEGRVETTTTDAITGRSSLVCDNASGSGSAYLSRPVASTEVLALEFKVKSLSNPKAGLNDLLRARSSGASNWWLQIDTKGELGIGAKSTLKPEVTITGSPSFTPGAVYNVRIVVDVAQSFVDIEITPVSGGTPSGLSFGLAEANLNAMDSLRLGVTHPTASRAWSAMIDDLRVYNRDPR